MIALISRPPDRRVSAMLTVIATGLFFLLINVAAGAATQENAAGTEPRAEDGRKPIITQILGVGLRRHFNPTETEIDQALDDMRDAGFTLCWSASPPTWTRHILENEAELKHIRRIADALREHGIGVSFGFHWHTLLPKKNPQSATRAWRGEVLNPETGQFETKNWNFGNEDALHAFATRCRKLFRTVGPAEMVFADEVNLAKAGKKSHLHRISTYWTSPTFSHEALQSFRRFLAGQGYPNAAQARFPVTTVEHQPGPKANMGLPAVPLNERNSDRLIADNNWPESPLWKHWYAWREGLYCDWLDTLTTAAYDVYGDYEHWLGCFYANPVHWMTTELGHNLDRIVRLPHLDYVIAGYTTGDRFEPVKKAAEKAGKGWGVQVEVSRYGQSEGMSPEWIEATFKEAARAGASIITCYAGWSLRTDMTDVSQKQRQKGWYYMPEQEKAWKACIRWLQKSRGRLKLNFDDAND